MTESEIADGIARFWERRGYLVHAEVEVDAATGRRLDLVALQEETGDVVVVECKTSFSQELRYQCASAYPYGRAVFAGIPIRQRSIPARFIRVASYGILTWDGAEVRVLRSAPRHLNSARPVDPALGWRCEATRLSCVPHNRWRPGEAGIPTRRGERVLTTYYILVCRIAAWLRDLGRPAALGEILDGVPGTRSHWRTPHYGLRDLLETEPHFAPAPLEEGRPAGPRAWTYTGEPFRDPGPEDAARGA